MASATDDSDPGTVLLFDWTAAESVTAAVVEAVATASGEPPTSIDPLYSAIDTDALDALFESQPDGSMQSGLFVEFPFGETLVQLHATGEGRVVPPG